jgi:hypothetical protein
LVIRYLSDLKVTPRLIDGSVTMQCDTVYLQSYAYTATKKCVISLNVKGLFNNGYCTGVKFYVNNVLMLTEETANLAVSYSYFLNPGDTFTVMVRYSNYTINEIDQRGFLIEFG